MELLNSLKDEFLYFFRGREDSFFSPLPAYSALHIVILIGFIALATIVYKGSFGLRASENRRKLSISLAVILLIDQVILYAWQFSTGYFNLQLSLPLYHCRIAITLLVIGVLFKHEKTTQIGMYWGILGSFMALLAPDMYKFQFPHYTNFQFFIAHICMGLLIINLLRTKAINNTGTETKFVLVVTNIYNVLLFIFNLTMAHFFGLENINYGYMNHFPQMISIELGPLTHFIIINVSFNILIILISCISKLLAKHQTCLMKLN